MEHDQDEAPDGGQNAGRILWARGVQVDGAEGTVFTGLDIDLPVGGFCVLHGPDSSGKTSALLALAGRMPFSSGEIEVAGHSLPRARQSVQRLVSLAEMAAVNDLDDALSVRAHVAERLSTRTLLPWARKADVEAVMRRYATALEAARTVDPDHGPRLDVGQRTRVGDLSGVERVLLGVTLALVGDPAVVVVDENGELRSRRERVAVAAALGQLMRTAPIPFAVVAASTEDVDRARLTRATGLPAPAVSVVRLHRPPMVRTDTPPDEPRTTADPAPTLDRPEPHSSKVTS